MQWVFEKLPYPIMIKVHLKDRLNLYWILFRTSNSAAVNLASAAVLGSPIILGTSFFLGPDVFPLLTAIISPCLNVIL